MAVFIRGVWMAIFLLGTGIFTWLDNGSSAMAWFLLTSVWSAVCGISYTVFHWFFVERISNNSC